MRHKNGHTVHTIIKITPDSEGDEDQRQKLKALQADWDRKMRGAGSRHNRFVLAQTFFWDHFYEKWHPSVQKFNALLNNQSE